MLEGVRVLDFTHTLAGPFATMVLADLGADVIKVEPPHGDEARHFTPTVRGESAYFLGINRGKRSIVVDLKTREGRDIIYKLIKNSHIIIENFRYDVLEKLGIDYKNIININQNIIYVSIKGFRQGSMYQDKTAYDLAIQAMSGLMATTGFEGSPPVRVSFALFDIFAGMMAVIYTLAALHTKRRPVKIEIPMFDVAIFSMTYLPFIYLMTGIKPKKMGNAHTSMAPYQAFKDIEGRWFVVGVANDRQWRAFCEAIGTPQLADDPRFKTNADRTANREILSEILQKIFEKNKREYWINILEKYKIPTAPVYEMDEVFKDPYVSDMIFHTRHSNLGYIPQLSEPVLLNGFRLNNIRPPPTLGEHTVEVLKELGYSDEEIKILKEKGIIYY